MLINVIDGIGEDDESSETLTLRGKGVENSGW